MNDLYKELAMEATQWCIENAKGAPVAWEWEKKLTELIVNECAHIAARAAYPDKNNVVLETVKKHFGVED